MPVPYLPKLKVAQPILLSIGFLLLLFSHLVAFFRAEALTPFFVHSSYYFMWGLFSLWLAISFFHGSPVAQNLKTSLRKNWGLVLAAALLTTLVFIAVTPQFRVFNDETNLLGVSKAMARSKTVTYDVMGYWYYDNYWPLESGVDKRPFFFPFLLSLLHSATGYRVSNSFALNGLVLFSLLVTLGLWLRSRGFSFLTSLSAQFLLLAQAIVVFTATSGAFDLLSLLFGFFLFISILFYLENPSSKNFGLVVAQLVVFGQIRTESFLFVLWIPFVLLLTSALKRKHITKNAVILLTSGFLFLPRVWQTVLKWNSFGNKPDEAVFSMGRFLVNVKEVRLFFWDLEGASPYASFANLLLLGFFFLRSKQKPERDFPIPWLGILVSTLGCLLVFHLSYYHGYPGRATSARFYLPLTLFLTVLFIRFWPRQYWGEKVLLGLSVTLFLHYQGIAREQRLTNSLVGNREYKIVRRFIEELPRNQRALLVVENPERFATHDISVISAQYFAEKITMVNLLMERHLFDEIYLVSIHRYEEKIKPVQDSREYQIDGESYLRIAKRL